VLREEWTARREEGGMHEGESGGVYKLRRGVLYKRRRSGLHKRSCGRVEWCSPTLMTSRNRQGGAGWIISMTPLVSYTCA